MSTYGVLRREFCGVELEIMQDESGESLMTSEQIGIALGYSFPRQAINKLFERHAAELDPYRVEVRLTSPGGAQEVTCWKKRAIYAMGFLAKTKRAAEFRMWAAKVFDDLEQGRKALVSREQFEELRDAYSEQAGMLEHAQRVLLDHASMMGRALAAHGHLRRKHPELFKIKTDQVFFGFYEAELLIEPKEEAGRR